MGPNGCGKSTLLRLLVGSLAASAGRILVDDKTPRELGRIAMARRMALVPQLAGGSAGDLGVGGANFTVRQIVLMARYPHQAREGGALGSLVPLGFESAEDLRLANVAMWNSDVHHLAERTLETLSGGERQRVAIARAVAQHTPILLLDEPTSALDLYHQLELLAQVEAMSRELPPRLIVMVTHDLNLAARMATRVLLMDEGKLAADGGPAEVLTAGHLEAIYRVKVGMSPDGMLRFERAN